MRRLGTDPALYHCGGLRHQPLDAVGHVPGAHHRSSFTVRFSEVTSPAMVVR